jgi:hypothetical protein
VGHGFLEESFPPKVLIIGLEGDFLTPRNLIVERRPLELVVSLYHRLQKGCQTRQMSERIERRAHQLQGAECLS